MMEFHLWQCKRNERHIVISYEKLHCGTPDDMCPKSNCNSEMGWKASAPSNSGKLPQFDESLANSKITVHGYYEPEVKEKSVEDETTTPGPFERVCANCKCVQEVGFDNDEGGGTLKSSEQWRCGKCGHTNIRTFEK